MSLIYKICPTTLWREAEAAKVFHGAPVDLVDGYIHFSTAEQVAETAAKHFAGEADLMLLAVRPEPLGPALRWEASRGGGLFPHLYGALPLSAVRFAVPLPLGEDGRHVFPEGIFPAAAFDPAQHGWERLGGENFIGLVGPLWARPAGEAAQPGVRRYGFLAETRHLNANGMVHGGMILSFVDHAVGMTARSVNTGNRQATAQLDTHFLSGVEDGEFVEAHCRLVRETKSLLFMAADLAVGARPVATAIGVWKIGPPLLPTGGGDAMPPDVSGARS
jgi:uncharacterized protein (DUF952 family)/acyl-coenzyme A thioesterase PaaI-like protein